MIRYRHIRFPEGKAKAVTFSYDDGVIEDKRFSSTLTEYGLKGTFNLNCDVLRKGNGFSDEDVKSYLLDKGHEIAVHGCNHRAEGVLRPIEGIRDVLECRFELEKKYGIIVRGMAYPDSGVTYFANQASYESIKNYLKELDIVYARTLGGDNDSFALPADWHRWMPTAHHSNPKIMEYVDKFLALNTENRWGPRDEANLLYIWGHSYEFERNGNWELLDEICTKLAGKPDIWYATNMEIYEYVNAYNSLVYSADSSLVYNPTLITVWFKQDGQLYCVKPGETIKTNA